MTLERWESRSEAALQAIAVVFLVAYAAPIIWVDLPVRLAQTCQIAVWITWAVFGIDYLARLGLSEQRWRWFYTNLPSLVILILPMLRPLRLLRLVTLIGVLNRTGSHSLRGKVAVYATGGVVLLVVCGALAITDAERGQPDAMIQGFGDGLWWAVTTITTVGYGDTFPLTTTGRIVAACLMAGGMALLGVVTAMLASWLVEQVDDSKAQSAANVQIVELERKIDELAEEIRREGGRCAS